MSIFLHFGQPLLNYVLKNLATETDSAYFALHHLKAMYNAASDKANKKFVSCEILLGASGLIWGGLWFFLSDYNKSTAQRVLLKNSHDENVLDDYSRC